MSNEIGLIIGGFLTGFGAFPLLFLVWLKFFHRDDQACEKCGHEYHNIRWSEASNRMYITCNRCGYRWHEKEGARE